MVVLLEQIENRIIWVIDRIVATMLFVMVVIIAYLVVLRYLLDSGVIGANEVLRMTFAYATMLGVSVAMLRREHIAIPTLVNILPAKAQHLLSMLSFLLIGALNLVMLQQGYIWIDTTGAYIMPSLQIPQIYFQSSVLVGCSLSLLFCLTRVLVLSIKFFTGNF